MLLYILNAVHTDTETTHGICQEDIDEEDVCEEDVQ